MNNGGRMPTGKYVTDALNGGAILVADDFPIIRKLIVNQLKEMGARNVIEVENGAEGIKAIEQFSVRMIITDWNMPVMSGLDLLRAARRHELYKNIPVIMITAEAERRSVLQAISNGVSEIIVKPFTPLQLKNRVIRALTRQAAGGGGDSLAPLGEVIEMDGALEIPDSLGLQKILIVDDSPESIVLLGEMLSKEYQVAAFKSPREALAYCGNGFVPDLMLIDVVMPEMDGVVFIEALRELSGYDCVPAILISSDESDDTKMRGFSCGAIDYIEKCTAPELIKLRIRNFMQYARIQRMQQERCDYLIENSRLSVQVEQITRHDLKGGLAVIASLAQAVLGSDKITQEQKGIFEQIDRAAMRTLDIINCSAEIYKIETGNFALKAEPFPLELEIRKVLEITSCLYSGKGIGVRVFVQGDTAPMAYADALLTYSALMNLLKNAFEAAPIGGEIEVVMSVTEAKECVIRMSNAGVVPRDIRDCFFEKFKTAGKLGGAGLGTYSAKLLIQAQNGRVSMATSDEDNRTMVEVYLPAAP